MLLSEASVAASMLRIVSANGRLMRCRRETHNQQKVQTGQNSAQCNKAHICASPLSNQSLINTLINYLRELDEEAPHGRPDSRSLAWFRRTNAAQCGQNKTFVFLVFCPVRLMWRRYLHH